MNVSGFWGADRALCVYIVNVLKTKMVDVGTKVFGFLQRIRGEKCNSIGETR